MKARLDKMKSMDISAKITGIKYRPFLCPTLNTYRYNRLNNAIEKDTSFILNFPKDKQIAISWWVSSKRTRSYPYSRVYDTLSFQGKKVTIIPVFKDEGKEGDRDFLQWDTISFMSLLGVYTIISYYKSAEKSPRYAHKITNQRFDIKHIKSNLSNLLSYQSDALHWNLAQVENIVNLTEKALSAYNTISKELGVIMHSPITIEKKIQSLIKNKANFMNLSRELAQRAQSREVATKQPKEKLEGEKATLTIKNYLGGYYHLTCDEVVINKENIYLIESKHSKRDALPSLEDIKDGLIKMILFTNLKEVIVNNKRYLPLPMLKLTSDMQLDNQKLSEHKKELLKLLIREANINRFEISLNGNRLTDYFA